MSGAQFRSWRKRMGWTQLKAARELGIGISTVKRLEARESYIPRVYELAACFIEQNGRAITQIAAVSARASIA